jgi:hypothetical protein
MIQEPDEFKRIKASINRGRIQRNVKTAIILIAASSGALISQPALAITATGTFLCLLLSNKIKPRHSVNDKEDN